MSTDKKFRKKDTGIWNQMPLQHEDRANTIVSKANEWRALRLHKSVVRKKFTLESDTEETATVWTRKTIDN